MIRMAAVLLFMTASVAVSDASASPRPIVLAYQTAQHIVIPDLSEFQVWVTTRNSTERGKALVKATLLTQDSGFLTSSLQGVTAKTASARRAKVLLSRLAKETAALGSFVNGYVAALQRTDQVNTVSKSELVRLGAIYRDALSAWLSVEKLAPAIGS